MTDPEQVPASFGPNAQQPDAHSESDAQASGMLFVPAAELEPVEPVELPAAEVAVAWEAAGVAAFAPPAAAVAAVEPLPLPTEARKEEACCAKPDAAAALAFGCASPKPQPPFVSNAITDPEQVPAAFGPNAQHPSAHSASEVHASGIVLS